MDRPDFRDEDEDLEEEESPPEVKSGRFAPPANLERYLGRAATFLGLTSIAILTFELVLGTIRLGTILAYAVATAVMLGVLMLLFLALKWASDIAPAGIARWAYWLFASAVTLIIYLALVLLLYDKLAHFFISLMKMAMANVL
ncbi:MAG: hypothetical protein IIA59_07165 [Candidatus Marinimicrobia bacterium]|nr:hypothetical protein [Candidatus Neomarinimicrobiota bacterium]